MGLPGALPDTWSWSLEQGHEVPAALITPGLAVENLRQAPSGTLATSGPSVFISKTPRARGGPGTADEWLWET